MIAAKIIAVNCTPQCALEIYKNTHTHTRTHSHCVCAYTAAYMCLYTNTNTQKWVHLLSLHTHTHSSTAAEAEEAAERQRQQQRQRTVIGHATATATAVATTAASPLDVGAVRDACGCVCGCGGCSCGVGWGCVQKAHEMEPGRRRGRKARGHCNRDWNWATATAAELSEWSEVGRSWKVWVNERHVGRHIERAYSRWQTFKEERLRFVQLIVTDWQRVAGKRERESKGNKRVGELANGECECGWRRDRQSCQLPLQISFSLSDFHSLSVSLWAMSFDVLGIICLKCVRAL